MAEAEVVKVDQAVEKEPPEEKAPDPIEDDARKMGWKPMEEYDGDERKWIPAKEYISRAPIFDEIKRWRKKATDLELTVNELKVHHSKVAETSYKRALDELKEQKAQALESGDHRKVVDIDDELQELKSNKPKPVVANQAPSPEFVAWVANNQWYQDDLALMAYADAIGNRYASNNKDKTLTEVFEYVTKKVKDKFPENFKNQVRERPVAVESSKTSPRKGKNYTIDDLSEVQRAAAKRFERQGIMTVDKYISDLVAMGEL